MKEVDNFVNVFMICVWGSPVGIFAVAIASFIATLLILTQMKIPVEQLEKFSAALTVLAAGVFAISLFVFPQFVIYIIPLGMALIGTFLGFYAYIKAFIQGEEESDDDQTEEDV